MPNPRPAWASLGIVIALGVWLVACAQQASPSGGPRDKTPPTIERTEPPTGALFFDDGSVTIHFSEVIRKPSFDKEIFISPLVKRPDIRLSDNGKRLTIKFAEALRPQTTYIITLNDVADANEGNQLAETYVMAFSTGDRLDSALLRGRIFLPELGQPAKGLSVLLFDPDSVADHDFLLQRPAYLTKANEQGEFAFRYLRQTAYRILAVQDEDQSNSYSLPSERVAIVLDSLVVPTEQVSAAPPADTTAQDSPARLPGQGPPPGQTGPPPGVGGNSPPLDTAAQDSTPAPGLLPSQDEALLKLLAFVADEQPPRLRSYDLFAPRTLALRLTEFPRLDSLDAWLTDTTGADSARPQALTAYRADKEKEVRLLVGLDRLPPLDLHLRRLGDSLGNAIDTVLRILPERLTELPRPVLLPPTARPDLKAWRVLLPRLLGDSAAPLIQVSDTARYDSLRQRFAFETEQQDFYLLIRPQALPNPDAPYLLSIAGRAGTADTALADSQFRYQLNWFDPESFGTLSGRVQLDTPYTGGLRLELLDSEQEVLRTVYDSVFRFQRLPAGEYRFRVLLDRDRNQTYTPGQVWPPRWPERTFAVPEPVTIRANWDFADHLVRVPVTDEGAIERPSSQPPGDEAAEEEAPPEPE